MVHAKRLSQAKAVKGQQSLLSDFGNQSVEGVSGGKFTWAIDYLGHAYGELDYTFSLRNRLRESVKNVRYLVIFYDQLGDPIDVTFEEFSETIPAGLAKRHRGKISDFSVKKLSTRTEGSVSTIKETYVKFRILDFEIVR